MVVFIDDEKWLIQAYIDELEWKAKEKRCLKPKHFFYGINAINYLRKTEDDIRLLVVDIGMYYGDNDLTNKEPGGIQFLKEIKRDEKLKNIHAIILTVFNKSDVESNFPIETDYRITFINRGDINRDKFFWDTVKSHCN